jgi:putative flippase GtrA
MASEHHDTTLDRRDWAEPVAAGLLARVGAGVKDRANWVQLVKFGLVGGSGYLINLAVFAVLSEDLALGHSLAAVGAFCVAISSNYAWNRRWTFGPGSGPARFEAARFFAVSVGALVVNLAALELLVAAGMPGLQAQALAVALAMPFNFLGNKLWAFR